MDSKPPEIKPDVNREPEGKKKAGFLASLLRWAGVGETSSMGGMGGGAGIFGAGGLLATKAGLLALIVGGSTLALGLAGIGSYLINRSPEDSLSGALSLFQPHPKEKESASVAAVASGQSASLQKLAEANQSPAGDASTPTTQTAASAANAVSDSVRGGGTNGPINRADAKPVPKHPLDTSKGKFGNGLDKLAGGGGSSAQASAPNNNALTAKGGSGSLGSMGRGVAAGARAAAGRALPRSSSSAKGQAQFASATGVQAVQTGNSGLAGTAFENNMGGGAQGLGSPGLTQGAQAKSMPNNASPGSNSSSTKPIPTPPTKNVTPWQNAINTAEMLLALATLLLFLIGKVPIGPWRYAIAGIVALLGAMVIALGAQISGGPYGQTLQGNVLVAAGVGMIGAAAWAMVNNSNDMSSKSDQMNQFKTANPSASSADLAKQDAKITSDLSSKTDSSMLGGINYYVLLGGGAALIAIAAVNLAPPKQHASTDFPNGHAPDGGFGYINDYPSSRALKRFV